MSAWGHDLITLLEQANSLGIVRRGPALYDSPSSESWVQVVIDDLVSKESLIAMLGKVDCHGKVD